MADKATFNAKHFQIAKKAFMLSKSFQDKYAEAPEKRQEQFAEAAGQLCAALDGENLAIQKRLKDRAMREVRRHKREAQREHQEAEAAKKRKRRGGEQEGRREGGQEGRR